MTDGDTTRLVAWHHELRAAHEGLRAALRLAQTTASAGGADAAHPARDLLLYCTGFCVALGAHHTGEDRALFPALAARHPQLQPVITKLEQDHSMIAHLLVQLRHALDAEASPLHVQRHLEGLAAIMESHFRFEERELLDVLAALELDADRDRVLGPL